MRIGPNNNSGEVNRILSQVPASRPRVEQPASEPDASVELKRALAQTPSLRAEKVAKARALLASGNYPSESALSHVAEILARHSYQLKGA